MNELPVVSIIVPIYNQEKYLDKSILSLLNQDYSNIEIILVNDGSTDGSAEIIKKYKSLDNRIKILNKKNGGLVDATIEGINMSSGDYICFLDPDDYLGDTFIMNFVKELDQDYDFIAMGFYRYNLGSLVPYFLKDDRVLDLEDIEIIKNNLLASSVTCSLPNDIFISRWNKIYKRECVEKVVKIFSKIKNVSLGEDSIFTYLILTNSTLGKTVKACNTYFYNIGNQTSMMKRDAADKHLKKAKEAFDSFSMILSEKGDAITQAYALYYYLAKAVLNRSKNIDKNEYVNNYKKLSKDVVYRKALKIMKKANLQKKERAVLILQKYIRNPYIFYCLAIKCVKLLKKSKNIVNDWVSALRKINTGLFKSIRLYRFKKSRRIAFDDIHKKLPLIEKRVLPLLKEYEGMQTDFNECTIEKNVFVFWWDGFDKAPDIVKACLKSVELHHKDYNVIKITKDTYEKYTDINPIIIQDYKKGKISVQTFSDILRFNLLKNNGGVWIDATIFFNKKYDLIKGLTKKPIESLVFSTSEEFLQYKNCTCSWSGYYIASRKNSIFVNVVDYIFEEYYLRYKTYSTYFFIDAILMLCKIYKVDNDALDKISFCEGDMFILGRLLNEKYSEYLLATINQVPQKLQWNMKCDLDLNSVYTKVIVKE